MPRTPIVLLLTAAIAAPVAIASFYFTPFAISSPRPCLAAGNIGYRLTGNSAATVTVRIDNGAPAPTIRMQIVDNAAAADFVLVDDVGAAEACDATTTIRSVRNDSAAVDADVIVALSEAPAEHKIYVRSAAISETDAAALFAAMWQDTAKTAARPLAGRAFAARH